MTYTTGDTYSNVGLFGWIIFATIKNLGLENVSISSGGSYVGGLAGDNNGGTIINCYCIGTVSGISHVGGLVGENDSGSITNCYADGPVSGQSQVGGLVGYHNSGPITACYATGSVTGYFWAGRLMGYVGRWKSFFAFSSMCWGVGIC